MTTSITTDSGTQAVALRYWGGYEYKTCLDVYARDRETAMKLFGHKRVRIDGCAFMTKVTFSAWLRKQEEAGVTIDYLDKTEYQRRSYAL